MKREHLVAIADVIRGHRFNFSSEAELQRGLDQLLRAHYGDLVLREFDLGKAGRVDFYIEGVRVGIESKTRGGPSAVAQQCHRYCGHEQIAGLILVSAKVGLVRRMNLPTEVQGKPVEVVSFWDGGF